MGSTTLGGYSQYNLPSKNQQTENLQLQESQRTVRHRENKQESFKKNEWKLYKPGKRDHHPPENEIMKLRKIKAQELLQGPQRMKLRKF